MVGRLLQQCPCWQEERRETCWTEALLKGAHRGMLAQAQQRGAEGLRSTRRRQEDSPHSADE